MARLESWIAYATRRICYRPRRPWPGHPSLVLFTLLIVPILESQGYDYFWRPVFDSPPFYCWFIKRDGLGRRTHHIHMVEPDFEHWDRLLFRDYLIDFPDVAAIYNQLKLRLAAAYPNDRVAYTRGKTEFVVRVTGLARQHYHAA
ncbi:MAG: GrpB family protein [Deltaproteobacteria bacterium]|nr:GrpB family protein [Deltaproteobacteria bacterium]